MSVVGSTNTSADRCWRSPICWTGNLVIHTKRFSPSGEAGVAWLQLDVLICLRLRAARWEYSHMSEQTTCRKTYKEKLRPTPAQERALERVLWHCRTLYNTALEQRITAWQRCHTKSAHIVVEWRAAVR